MSFHKHWKVDMLGTSSSKKPLVILGFHSNFCTGVYIYTNINYPQQIGHVTDLRGQGLTSL